MVNSCIIFVGKWGSSFLRLVGVIGIPLAIFLMLEYTYGIVVVVVLKGGNYLCVLFVGVCLLAILGVLLEWLYTLGVIFWLLVGYIFVVMGCRLL